MAELQAKKVSELTAANTTLQSTDKFLVVQNADDVLRPLNYSSLKSEITSDLVTVTTGLYSLANTLNTRTLHTVSLLDFLSDAKKANVQAGNSVDITTELQTADDYLVSGGELYIPKGNYYLTNTVNKHGGTWWLGSRTNSIKSSFAEKTGQGTVFVSNTDSTMIRIDGHRSSLDGGIDGIRLLGNTTLYANCVAINASNTFTHSFKNMRIGGFKDGIVADGWVKALYFDRIYTFSCTQDGVRVSGNTQIECTDHWAHQCQFTGDRYGLYCKTGATFSVNQCRPQSSGVSNLCFEDYTDFCVMGHYNDTANNNTATGGGNGIRIINSNRGVISSVNFYTNGNTDPHISIFANDAQTSDIIIQGITTTKGAGHTSVEGIQFNTPTGANGIYKRITIQGCNFFGVDTAIAGSQHVAQQLYTDGNIYPISQGETETLSETGSNVSITRAYTKYVRLPGTTANNYHILLPSAGNYENKIIEISRLSGSGGSITVTSPDGGNVGVLTTANQVIRARCTTSSAANTSVAFKVA